jgi:hypothetical protein
MRYFEDLLINVGKILEMPKHDTNLAALMKETTHEA